jgi:septal ring-binding cell division protein DamX
MASRGNRGGAGERVLESRHVIGLFLLMLVFSGVFFALGYVMGRNQYDGQVRAASNPRATADPVPAPKSEPPAKHSAAGNSAPRTSPDAATDVSTQPDSDWGFYNSGKTAPDDTLKPAAPANPGWAIPNPKTTSRAAGTSPKSSNAQASGNYTVQVAALRREADAQAVALTLQKKKFLAFVVSPQSDAYFHVQVGPYPDQKSAEAAKKGLESAGFKAIVKH